MNLLKIYRMKKGVNQLEMAQALGVSEQKVCRIETGRFKPDALLKEKMAQYLGLTLENVESALQLMTSGKDGEHDA